MIPLRWKRFTVILIIGVLMTFMIAPAISAQDELDDLRASERLLTSLYERISPAVVSIRVDQFINGSYQEWSGGSGFVIDEDGHIVTNYHVVEGADRIVVSFPSGTIVVAELIGADPYSDVAIIQIDALPDDVTPLFLADSDKVRVGQTTLAIGSPFGQNWTLTTGIVSALNRQITSLSSFDIGAIIQTDTAINPGNSGGPLLNLDGAVIGVNTQILSERRASSGVGFAVPSNLVRRVADELIQNGEVNYGYIGIDGEDVSIDYIQDLRLPNDVRGVVVVGVRPGQPAALAGVNPPETEVRRGQNHYLAADIIVAIDDTPINSFADLLGYTATYTYPGETIILTVLRDGILVNLDLTLGSR